MNICMAQIDSRIGDLAGNLERILAAHRRAERLQADLVVYPELVLSGYPPRDLLFEPDFLPAVERTLELLTAATSEGPPLVVGTPLRCEQGLYNGAVLLHQGRQIGMQAKRLLPGQDVFHENRWFIPGQQAEVLSLPGLPPFELRICEDLWGDLPSTDSRLVIALNASPYRREIFPRRLQAARRTGKSVYYCNAVGAQDELIFDGGSFALDQSGNLVGALPRFEEEVDFPVSPFQELSPSEELRRALVLGIRGFFAKNGVRQAVLGLSGGIDSALVACLAVEALGPDRVRALALPSRHTDPRSTESATELAAQLGIELEVVPLEPIYEPARHLLGVTGTAAENLQARLRMVALMARVNQGSGLLLNTSNKTELTLGYGTLYGDLCGTLGPLNDLTKPQVYQLARLYPEIPEFILSRPPSAELSEGQVDPFDYPSLAPQLEELVQKQTWSPELARSEHKRRQGPIGLKVSEKAFGTGRFVPVTARMIYPPEDFCYHKGRTGAALERSRDGQPGAPSLHSAGGRSTDEPANASERPDRPGLRGGYSQQRSGSRGGLSGIAL
ncbi:MAG: NAD+ synthase [Candidatus Xenobia bacterium]